MQSSIQPGRHHRPSCRYGSRATCGSEYRSAEEVSFGATRDKQNWRTLNNSRFRATWKLVRQRSKMELLERSGDSVKANRMVSDPRRLGCPISRCRRMRIQGNLSTDRRRYRGCKAKRRLGAFTTGTAERERIEATRRSITGKAGDAG
jgi:hypothetical protein